MQYNLRGTLLSNQVIAMENDDPYISRLVTIFKNFKGKRKNHPEYKVMPPFKLKAPTTNTFKGCVQISSNGRLAFRLFCEDRNLELQRDIRIMWRVLLQDKSDEEKELAVRTLHLDHVNSPYTESEWNETNSVEISDDITTSGDAVRMEWTLEATPTDESIASTITMKVRSNLPTEPVHLLRKSHSKETIREGGHVEEEPSEKMSHTIALFELKKVGISCLEATLTNLCNATTKLEAEQSNQYEYKREQELPMFCFASPEDIQREMMDVLCTILKRGKRDPRYGDFMGLVKGITQGINASEIVGYLESLYEKAWDLVKDGRDEIIGVIPKISDVKCFRFECHDETHNKHLKFTWSTEKLGDSLFDAVSRMLELVREERRQPTPEEFLVTHVVYSEFRMGKLNKIKLSRCLGTPGFRPDTQTYVSLTDPGTGHVMGTTRFREWMEGAIVHVEHIERPRTGNNQNTEAYRLPSILDFFRVRLHVGSSAPATFYLGRTMQDCGNFNDNFRKIVHVMAAVASEVFSLGAAECKLSMDQLTTSQAVRYMRALRAQVVRSRKQFLSAAWNITRELTDDYELEEAQQLQPGFDIASRAVMMTTVGGFDKITWNGSSTETTPSVCITTRLATKDARTVVHEAHERGLLTYVSAGITSETVKDTVNIGVDGFGIGGAKELRFVDSDSGFLGPYREENIQTILEERNKAAEAPKGRYADLLARLDTMYFEGSLPCYLDKVRKDLFKALRGGEEEDIKQIMEENKEDLEGVEGLPREGTKPFLYMAKRITESDNPTLKRYCTPDKWTELKTILREHIGTENENALVEEYDRDPWLSIREEHRQSQKPYLKGYVRRASFDLPYRFH